MLIPRASGLVIVCSLALAWSLYDRAGRPAKAQAPAEPPRPPYVASDTALSDSERLRVVVVPHPLGRPWDMRCVLYTGRDGAAQLTCPNATQDQVSEVAR